MSNDPLPALAWLVFAVGVGVILIATLRGKRTVHSPMRRLAMALTGLFFCLVAATEAIPGISGTMQVLLLAAAALTGFASWYIGRHAKKMDRMARR